MERMTNTKMMNMVCGRRMCSEQNIVYCPAIRLLI